tara:strand:- start:841 stop:1767 length:927 start_codon:yes stop_codon:yes gene_type:complete
VVNLPDFRSEARVSEKREQITYDLEDLQVFEVSLVNKPANGRAFYMTKAADKGNNQMVNEKILALMETPLDSEDKIDAMISKAEMSEDAVAAVRAALRLLDAFKDEIPSDTLTGLAAAAGMDMHMEEEREMEDEADKGYHDMDKTEEMISKADIPEDLRPTLEALWKSNQEQQERVKQLEGVLKAERDERLLNEETERISKAYSRVPGGEPSKVAQLLIDLRKAAPDSASAVEEILTATQRALVAKEDGAFEEAGANVVESAPGDTWGKIQAMASERVTKGLVENHAKAVDQVLTENPELYAAYMAEK